MHNHSSAPRWQRLSTWIGKVLGVAALVLGLIATVLRLVGQFKAGDPNPWNLIVNVVVAAAEDVAQEIRIEALPAETLDLLNLLLEDEARRRGISVP